MIDHVRTQPAKLLTTTTDGFGDQKEASSVDILIRFRYNTVVDRNANREQIISEAIIWLDPELEAVEGSIILYDGIHWRITRLVKARRLTDATVQFLKAYVDKHVL